MSLIGKRIVIIGGGISGLALLHYLKIKYYFRKDVEITLFEKEHALGGTIRTIHKENYIFETGPNGFLDSKPRTLQFIHELNLDQKLARASEAAKIRYISVNHTLHPLPTTPQSFFSFPLLNFLDKLRVFIEIIIPRGRNPKETVFAFGQRRLGEKFSQFFLDPMVSGIHGGDARQINLKAAFPKIYAMEQEHGSLFRAMIALRKKKGKGKGTSGEPSGTLTSFSHGLSDLVNTIGKKYAKHIQLNQTIRSISRHQKQYVIYSNDKQYMADELFVCTPASVAADLLQGISAKLSNSLKEINYAPIAVLGFVFSRNIFKVEPKGFGYLIPSSEKNEILGVLFDSNIFINRTPDDKIMFRLMIGGARHPDILKKTQEELTLLALNEIKNQFSFKDSAQANNPVETFFVTHSKAIPQYDLTQVTMSEKIETELKIFPRLHLRANYLNGISFNDCIENSYRTAQGE